MPNEDHCPRCGKPFDEHPDDTHYLGGESKGVIRIVKTPEGEAPLEIREKWVGVEMRAFCYESETHGALGVVSGDLIAPHASYQVDEAIALEALEKAKPGASAYWRERGFPHTETSFVFRADEVIEVVPVSPRL